VEQSHYNRGELGLSQVVIVIHGPFGSNADAKSVANRLAREGPDH